MRTSDKTVISCMNLMGGALVGIRTMATALIVLRHSQEMAKTVSLMAKEILLTATECRSVLACLLKDMGDRVVGATLLSAAIHVNATEVANPRQRERESGVLVDDLTKDKIFRFLDSVFENLEAQFPWDTEACSYDLYDEMDRVHNVPQEIYQEEKMTVRGFKVRDSVEN